MEQSEFFFLLLITVSSIVSLPVAMSLRIVAAGRGRTMSLPKMVDTVLQLAKNKSSKPSRVVYLGTATYDEDDAMEDQCKGLQEAGCQVIALKVSERMETIPTAEEIRDTILSANVILVSGGNTLYAINRWKQLGIDELIRTASAQNDAVLCGGSAGAICWFDEGHSDSMDPTTFLNVDPNLTEQEKKNWNYIRVQGLGFLPALCVPHHDATQSNGLPRTSDSDEMMKEWPTQPCLGIDEQAALVVDGDQAKVVAASDKAMCCLKLCKARANGEYEIISHPFTETMGSVPLAKLWSGEVLGSAV